VGWKRSVIAYHEAGHAVVARHFGLEVVQVTAGRSQPASHNATAGWSARDFDTAGQITAYEKDAIVALAGFAAQRRKYPKATYDFDRDVFHDTDDDDMANARSATYKIFCLGAERALPAGENFTVEVDEAARAAMRDVFDRLRRQTGALVEQLWPAIVRVATALERRDLGQTDLDRLIKGGLT
jgi:hypothetical protein